MRRATVLAAASVLAFAAAPASAHETLHEVQRGKAIAVKACFASGEALAYAPYEVYSPADPEIPYQEGRSDRNGWVAFVPNAAGKWRLKVIDESGHGLHIEVEADAPAGAAAAQAPTAGAASSGAFLLRSLVGLAAIGAVFAALILAHRRKGTTR